MITFGMNNLRRLVSVPPVEIKPITLLVGRNSSGKSSFLRAFPLVRQSLMTRTSSPILWYGDFVDFGSFEGAVTDNDVTKDIAFAFGVDELGVQDPSRPYYRSEFLVRDIKLEVAISSASDTHVSASEKTEITSISLSFRSNDDAIRYSMQVNSQAEVIDLLQNGTGVLEYFSEYRMILTQGTIFPEIVLRPIQGPSPNPVYTHHTGPLLAAMGQAIAPHLDSRIKSDRLDTYSDYLLSLSEFNKERIQRLNENITAARSFKSLLMDLSDRDSKGLFAKLQSIYFANRFAATLNRVSQYLRDTISSTLYIGPARARSERYYRYQDLSVSDDLLP